MTLSRSAIEAMAPDQSALKAVAGLLKPGKWDARGRAGELIWGECQGSGANPYRVCADIGADPGSKCTCPSRKFPCKHALALMWLDADDAAGFAPAAAPPAWVGDWMGRRRRGAAPAGARSPLRSVIVSRHDDAAVGAAWPAGAADPLAAWRETLLASPWRLEAPLVLPSGRVCEDAAGRAWWRGDGEDAPALPLAEAAPPVSLGARLSAAAGLWNGARLSLLAAQSDWGRLSFAVANLGAPVFACTPDQFPDLMAAALKRDDIHAWAAAADIKTVRAEGLGDA